MATNASTTASTTTTASKAASKAATATSGPYRSVPAWHAAHQAALGQQRGNATHRATVGVLTHLGWRAPGGSVAWHKGTNAAMLAHAATLGVRVGMPVHAAVALCVAALPAHPTTTALHKATAALAPAPAKG
jgi:hypothetical protein